jgi:hypothetical protein
VSKWTARQSFLYLVGSTCLTLVLGIGGFWGIKSYNRDRMDLEKYKITAITQTGPEKEALKTAYLSDLLGLSIDTPLSLYAYDLREGERRLLASPLITKAKLKRSPPNTLYVEYEVRKPIAMLADYSNIAVDAKGYLFPMAPFFTPKNLTEIYLGLPPFGTAEDKMGRTGGEWLRPIQNPYFELASEILRYLETSPWREGLRVKRIDVSNAFAPSLGQREVVLFTEEEIHLRQPNREFTCVFPKILRLAPREYPQQINNFFSLRKTMLEDYKRQLATAQRGGRFAPRIIDLRIPQLAFVEKG